MNYRITFVALVVFLIALSGCPQPAQPSEIFLTEEQANEASKLAALYDEILPEETILANADCKLIDGMWCSEESRQEWEEGCQENPIPEECIAVAGTHEKNWTYFARRMRTEKETKKAVALRINETRSIADLIEVSSSIQKIGLELIAFSKGSENEFGCGELITFGTPFKGTQDKYEAIVYFKKARNAFESNRSREISDDTVWSLVSGGDSPSKNPVLGLMIGTMPEQQKTEIMQKARMGFDEFKTVCNQEAGKFDVAEKNGDVYQMAFSSGYLETCNEFLQTFKIPFSSNST
ncbi:MAG: hypothetical protein JW772_02600 [Candidatus Diapherotrites archaeon]|nr:hypothetical protein [Candidatus Diapherotrites archaeon]